MCNLTATVIFLSREKTSYWFTTYQVAHQNREIHSKEKFLAGAGNAISATSRLYFQNNRKIYCSQ